MKQFVLLFILLSFQSILSQSESDWISDIEAHQLEQNTKFTNPETTILEPKDLKEFKALDFYDINLKFRIEAKFVRTPDEVPFLMPTTTSRLPEYVKYGEIHFNIDGKPLKLNLYQNTDHENQEGYEDYLFLPFTDLTSGDGSYGGGRFIDMRIPEGDKTVVDFNKSYNPYCAYSPNYSCPIPPKENDILVRIEAGVKDFGEH